LITDFNISIFLSIKKKIIKHINTGSKDTRSGFGAGMTELGQKNENVVALCADLIGSANLTILKSPRAFFPNRNCSKT
jgi:transketolase